MSTRTGTVVFLDDILEQTKEKMHEMMKRNPAKYEEVKNPEATADIVRISAVMIQDMSAKRVNNYTFDWNRMFSFEGDTGPYLQYSHSRVMSIARNSGVTEEQIENADLSLLSEPAAINLMKLLSQCPNVIRTATNTHEPAAIVTYLFRLTHALNHAYDQLYVINQKDNIKHARAALYTAIRIVLGNGMRVLNLTPLEWYFIIPNIV